MGRLIYFFLVIILLSCSEDTTENMELPIEIDTSKLVGSWILVSNERNGIERGTTSMHGYQCATPYVWIFEENRAFESAFCTDFEDQLYPWEIKMTDDEQFLLIIDIGRSWFHGGYILQLDDNILKFERPDFNNLGNVDIRTFEREI